jgi:hypothetical protein
VSPPPSETVERDLIGAWMAMRASLAVGGLRRRLPVTAILSERAFNENAANGKPGWRPFLLTIGAVRDELFNAASAMGDGT